MNRNHMDGVRVCRHCAICSATHVRHVNNNVSLLFREMELIKNDGCTAMQLNIADAVAHHA